MTLHPFVGAAGEKVSLNFTKMADDFPDAGFSFLLIPFPGTSDSGNEPPNNSQSPGSDVFDDGYLLSHMGDGSVFLVMPPTLRGSDNPLNGILIGLSQPDIDPNHILIGLSQPTISQDDANPEGILIGLLLPAVQTGESNPAGILIGLLLPAVQTDLVGFSNQPFLGGTQADTTGGSGGGENFPPSIREIRTMGLNFFVPSDGAAPHQFFAPGWSVQVEGIVMPTE